MKKILWMFIIFSLNSLSANATSPVSKEYVDQQDQKLQTQINKGTSITINLVGDFYQGGVIYWLDPTSLQPQHGLIADLADQNGTFQWGTTNVMTGATGNGAYAGKNSPGGNTYIILHQAPPITAPAATACATSQSGGYEDWYLPSIMELALMFDRQMTITFTALAHGGSPFSLDILSGSKYWSSTDSNVSDVFVFDFLSGQMMPTNLKQSSLRVRCIRAF